MSARHTQRTRALLGLVPLAIVAATAAFALGTKTAGTLRTVEESSATDDTPRGDVNADGTVDGSDAILILEISQGYRDATADELGADPNGNGALTVDDAIRVLRSLRSR